MTQKPYTCAMCGGVFEPGWTEEEALAELEEFFPGEKAEDCDQVCEVCWEMIRPVAGEAENGPERLLGEHATGAPV